MTYFTTQTDIVYTNDRFPISDVAQVRRLANKRCGVSVAVRQLKIGGILQPHFVRVRVTLSETAIGRTCDGPEYMSNERETKRTLVGMGFAKE